MDVPVGYFLAALSWAGLGVQFIAIPFYSRREKLFRELMDGGAIDLAVTNIEAARLIPALASVFENAERVRDARRARGDANVEYEDLLHEVDFLPALDTAQAAINEQRDIHEKYESLCEIASRLWKIALLHAFSIVGIPIAFQLVPALILVTVVTVLVGVAIGTFVASGIFLVNYERRCNELYKTLGQNRGKTKVRSA